VHQINLTPNAYTVRQLKQLGMSIVEQVKQLKPPPPKTVVHESDMLREDFNRRMRDSEVISSFLP
jgi:hypothetical protein